MDTAREGHFEARYNALKDQHEKTYSRLYSSDRNARATIDKIKGHKQTVLKAVITLILDGLLVMDDDELKERYFVDIGNIIQTRNTIKRERK